MHGMTTHPEETKDAPWGFARDMQWGQAGQQNHWALRQVQSTQVCAKHWASSPINATQVAARLLIQQQGWDHFPLQQTALRQRMRTVPRLILHSHQQDRKRNYLRQRLLTSPCQICQTCIS